MKILPNNDVLLDIASPSVFAIEDLKVYLVILIIIVACYAIVLIRRAIKKNKDMTGTDDEKNNQDKL